MGDANYLVNVKCPHCNTPRLVAISGYGGELAVREKECTKCGKAYFVQILTQTTAEKIVPDGRLTELRRTIIHLNDARNVNLGLLLLKHEAAKRAYNEALEMAEKMRTNKSFGELI